MEQNIAADFQPNKFTFVQWFVFMSVDVFYVVQTYLNSFLGIEPELTF